MVHQVVETTKRLAAERQIHAAIAHYRAGEFECAISLCSAAEGQTTAMPGRPHLFTKIREGFNNSAPEDPKEKNKDDEAINLVANWLKHGSPPDEIDIPKWNVLMWLSRAISKYRAAYGPGTPEMVAMFDWAGNPD